jgi:hypothetical protein
VNDDATDDDPHPLPSAIELNVRRHTAVESEGISEGGEEARSRSRERLEWAGERADQRVRALGTDVARRRRAAGIGTLECEKRPRSRERPSQRQRIASINDAVSAPWSPQMHGTRARRLLSPHDAVARKDWPLPQDT